MISAGPRLLLTCPSLILDLGNGVGVMRCDGREAAMLTLIWPALRYVGEFWQISPKFDSEMYKRRRAICIGRTGRIACKFVILTRTGRYFDLCT